MSIKVALNATIHYRQQEVKEKNLLSKNKHWDEKNLPRDLNERKTLTLMTSFFSRPLEFLTPHGLDGGHRKGGQKC